MTKKHSLNLKDMKQLNKAVVLEKVWRSEGLSRIELAESTGLSPASITSIVDDLLQAGLIIETRIGESTGGRRPVILTINPDGGYLCSVAVTSRKLTFSLANLELATIQEFETPNSEEVILQHLFDNIVQYIDHMFSTHNEAKGKLIGLGISLPEEYACFDQRVLFDTGVSVDRMNLDEALRYRYRTQVLVEKDINARAIAEYYFGAAKGFDNYVYIDVGNEIKAAVVIGGELPNTPALASNDIGHMIIDRNGPRCSCGRRGCLQMFASAQAIVKRVFAGMLDGRAGKLGNGLVASPDNLKFETVVDCSNNGNAFAREVFDEAAESLCIGILNFASVFQVSNFVVGGLITRPACFQSSLTKGVDKYRFGEEGLSVSVSTLSDGAVILGNKVMGLNSYFRRNG